MHDVELTFRNESNDAGATNVVVFGKNESAPADVPVAWKVIAHSRPGEHHRIVVPAACEVRAEWGAGVEGASLRAEPGQAFTVADTPAGPHLRETGRAAGADIQVVNGLARGAIAVNVYRDGRLFATKDGVAPGQKAVFSATPVLRIGVAPGVNEGDAVSPAVMGAIEPHELSLAGLATATIVMTGGGAGSNAAPYTFTLANVA